jgi:hypothetical membrane protein
MVENVSSDRNGEYTMSTEKNKVLEPSTHGGPSRSGQTTTELRERNALRFMANVNRTLKTAGILAFVAAAQWVLLVIVAETQYPNYSIQQNYLSDLGATCHRGLVSGTPCVIVSPSSLIWDTTLALMGLLSLVSAILVYGATRKKGFSILFGIWGLGALIAGAVPETLLSVHELASLASLLAGSIAAIVAFWFLKSPLKYLSLVLDLFSFASLIPLTSEGPFFRWNGIFGLGLGGIERMVVYPIIIWEIAFGAYLMSGALSTSRAKEAKPTDE